MLMPPPPPLCYHDIVMPIHYVYGVCFVGYFAAPMLFFRALYDAVADAAASPVLRITFASPIRAIRHFLIFTPAFVVAYYIRRLI